MGRRRRQWLIGLALFLGIAGSGVFTRGIWLRAIGRCLVCDSAIAQSDAILVDNFDYNFQVFERTASLQQSGISSRIFVPAQASVDPTRVSLVPRQIAEVMLRAAEVQNASIFPVTEREPISLNVAYEVRNTLARAGVRSIVLVSPGFRSRRSALVYARVLSPSGISVSCAPVFGSRTPDTWAQSWHGVQEVTEQFLKLQYYRFYVLPFLLDDTPVRRVPPAAS